MPARPANSGAHPHSDRMLDGDELDALMVALSRRIGATALVLETRGEAGRLDNLTLRIQRPGEPAVDIDIAHVETFESSTWEPAPHDLSSLVGARGHTMHSKDGAVGFRLATWTDRFTAERIALAIERRLSAEPAS